VTRLRQLVLAAPGRAPVEQALRRSSPHLHPRDTGGVRFEIVPLEET
jgi:hypothetical protein